MVSNDGSGPGSMPGRGVGEVIDEIDAKYTARRMLKSALSKRL